MGDSQSELGLGDGTHEFETRFQSPQDESMALRRPELRPILFMLRIKVHGKIACPVDARTLCVSRIRDVIDMSLNINASSASA